MPINPFRPSRRRSTQGATRHPHTLPSAPAPAHAPTPAAEPPYPRWGEAADDPALNAVVGAAKAQDWPTLRAALAPYRADDRTELLEGLCAKRGTTLGTWLPEAIAGEQTDPLARTVLGAYTIHAAWVVRTAKPARKVSPEQMSRFHEMLREAEQYLMDATVMDPADSAPRYYLLKSGRGLTSDHTDLMHRFELVLKCSPGHCGAHEQMLQVLCKKWHGSHEMMFEFARAAMRGPEAESVAALVAQAHIEHWVYCKGDEEADRFIRTPESREELRQAADLTLFRPGYRSGRRPYKYANTFAFAFSLAEMWPEARLAFQAADGVLNGYWLYLDREHPQDAFVAARAKALENA